MSEFKLNKLYSSPMLCNAMGCHFITINLPTMKPKEGQNLFLVLNCCRIITLQKHIRIFYIQLNLFQSTLKILFFTAQQTFSSFFVIKKPPSHFRRRKKYCKYSGGQTAFCGKRNRDNISDWISCPKIGEREQVGLKLQKVWGGVDQTKGISQLK